MSELKFKIIKKERIKSEPGAFLGKSFRAGGGPIIYKIDKYNSTNTRYSFYEVDEKTNTLNRHDEYCTHENMKSYFMNNSWSLLPE